MPSTTTATCDNNNNLSPAIGPVPIYGGGIGGIGNSAVGFCATTRTVLSSLTCFKYTQCVTGFGFGCGACSIWFLMNDE